LLRLVILVHAYDSLGLGGRRWRRGQRAMARGPEGAGGGRRDGRFSRSNSARNEDDLSISAHCCNPRAICSRRRASTPACNVPTRTQRATCGDANAQHGSPNPVRPVWNDGGWSPLWGFAQHGSPDTVRPIWSDEGWAPTGPPRRKRQPKKTK
jgi:hypothetical protein